MTDRRGFLGGMASALGAVVFNRGGFDHESLFRWVDDGWEVADITGVLVANEVPSTVDYKVTVNGRMLTDCTRVCPREGWYEVCVHKDGKDDFDPEGVVMLDDSGKKLVLAVRRGPVKVWKRRVA